MIKYNVDGTRPDLSSDRNFSRDTRCPVRYFEGPPRDSIDAPAPELDRALPISEPAPEPEE